jgi:DNA-binding MarR family transcriptional regulator
VGAVADHQPLGRLLAAALTAVIDELHERLERAGWPRVRPMWGFALLAVRTEARTIGELGETLGITKQAAAKVVSALVDEGLVERQEHPTDRRAAALRLTDRGHRFLTDAEAAYEAIEAGWAQVASRHDIDALRRAIPALLTARYGETKPPLRPTL